MTAWQHLRKNSSTPIPRSLTTMVVVWCGRERRLPRDERRARGSPGVLRHCNLGDGTPPAEKRLTYAALKHIFGLDEATLDVVRQELILAKRVAADEHGRVLVWTREPSLDLSTPPLVTSTTGPNALPTTLPGMSLISPDVVPTLPMEEGAPEAADKVTRHTPAPRGSTPEAERRQVTVLFCDLVDSTKLSQQLDAEDYRAVVRAYQEAAVAALQPWDGYVAQYLGDGLMVYFGWATPTKTRLRGRARQPSDA